MPPKLTIAPEVQFASLEHQGETAQYGMWIFLATETMFFGALVFSYFVYRTTYWPQFAVAGRDAVFWCGSVNIAILLTSSLTMVLAINAGAQGRRREMVWFLVATLALGVIFMCIKGYEYYQDWTDRVIPAVNFLMKPEETPSGELFWVFYWIATSLHALHLLIGIGVLAGIMFRLLRRTLIVPDRSIVVAVGGVYWHLVDVVWIFLYPALYLAR